MVERLMRLYTAIEHNVPMILDHKDELRIETLAQFYFAELPFSEKEMEEIKQLLIKYKY